MESKEASERDKRSAALFHNPNQDVKMAVHGDDIACLSDDDGLKHIDSLLKSKYTAKDMGTLGFEDSDVKKLSVAEPCVQELGLIELDCTWTLNLT